MDFFNDTCIKLSLNPYKIKTSTVTDLNQFSSFVWIFNLEKITDLKMKIMKLLLVVMLLAVAGVAGANSYDYSFDAQEVIVGEEAVPAPSVESYGVMPSWATGCCERQPSKADYV